MQIIRASEARRTETPNAVMTTHASPTLGGAGHALWRVEMEAGQAGPPHIFDTEQIWTAMDGEATIECDGETVTVSPGDTVVVPAYTPRRVVADADAGLVAIVTARAGARASLVDGTDKGVPAWIA